MADVVYVLIIVAFFALAAGLVRLCDRIIGPDSLETDLAPAEDVSPGEPAEVAA